ncbi:MAG TPA: metallophosphoesterase [Candidatus Sulfobium mesophilum]|nr:metallophosphoesterase [Candidatus Sulfobium mesophilum]
MSNSFKPFHPLAMSRPMNPKKFFIVLCIVLFVCSPAFSGQSFPAGKGLEELGRISGRFTFAVIGDTRSGEDTYSKLVKMVMEREPAFVISLGDAVSRPGSLSDWKRFRELSSPISVPYFLAVGNHDVDDEESERIFKEQVSLAGNGLYYSFSAGDALFIVLDSNLAGHKREISSVQLDWLTEQLKISGRQHKFVFPHHPLYSDRLSLSGILGGSRKSRERLRDILKSGQIDAVFAGISTSTRERSLAVCCR